jgi:hypothetical protein
MVEASTEPKTLSPSAPAQMTHIAASGSPSRIDFTRELIAKNFLVNIVLSSFVVYLNYKNESRYQFCQEFSSKNAFRNRRLLPL